MGPSTSMHESRTLYFVTQHISLQYAPSIQQSPSPLSLIALKQRLRSLVNCSITMFSSMCDVVSFGLYGFLAGKKGAWFAAGIRRDWVAGAAIIFRHGKDFGLRV